MMADDDDDDDKYMTKIRPSINSAFRGSNNNRERDRDDVSYKKSNPIITISQMRDDFDQNPIKKIMDAVPVHDNPEGIESLDQDKVQRVIDNHANQIRNIELLYRNKEFELIELIKGGTRDPTSSMASMGPAQSVHSIPIVTTTNVNRSLVDPVSNPNKEEEEDVGYFNLQRRDINDTDNRQLQRIRAIENIIDSTVVTGRVAITAEMKTAMAEADARLSAFDYEKFRDKDRFCYLGERAVMTLYAGLVSLFVHKIHSFAPRFHLTNKKDEALDKSIDAKVYQCYYSFVWNSADNVFRMATPGEQLYNKQKKVQDFVRMQFRGY